MKLKLIATSVITLLLYSLPLSYVFAADVNHSSAITKSSIHFKADDMGTTPPIDPSNPGEATNPEDSDNMAPSTGALRIDYVSLFDFGKNKISTTSQTYYAKKVKLTDPATSSEKYVRNYIQITDARGAQESQGWEVQASATPFISEDQDRRELIGAEIRIENVTVNIPPGVEPENSPTGVASEIKLSKQPVTVLTAGPKKGEGLWTANFGDSPDAETSTESVVPENRGLKLYIPGGSQKIATRYISHIRWTIATGP